MTFKEAFILALALTLGYGVGSLLINLGTTFVLAPIVKLLLIH